MLVSNGATKRPGGENAFPAEDDPTPGARHALNRANRFFAGFTANTRILHNRPPLPAAKKTPVVSLDSIAIPFAANLARTMTPPPVPTSTRTPTPFHLLTKPMGPLCNLDCTYCFYLEKTKLYPDTHNFRMSDEVLERYIRDYIASQPGEEVAFAWQGGEPTLLGVGFFRKVVELQRRHANGRRITNALQTNGTLLDDEWGVFLREQGFLVGISIDGPRALHDAYRVDRGGKSTFDRVMAGLECLKRNKVDFNTLAVVNRQNSRKPREVYQFLRRFGSRFMQFIPLVERLAPAGDAGGLSLASPPDLHGDADPATQVTAWSVRPEHYGEFLVAIFDEWVRRDVGRVFVQLFDATLANWVGAPAGVCVFSEKCGRALAIEHNGDVYSCDHYVYPSYRLGNVMSESLGDMVESQRQRKFGADKSDTLPAYCRACDWRFACHGECPKHRFLRTPDGEPGLNYLCAAYKRFFSSVAPYMDVMAQLLRSQQSPAGVMAVVEKIKRGETDGGGAKTLRPISAGFLR
ncbi:MAG: anaerobic sulfatase maturase [Verrucomicrobia bacterium RIFCSPLOWO2_12_FULL_64_8]|nr:MAG: anaerobic sulfatase maturase [Verrucomicrobia bacterium RIFCSPLOWO2_12_FULL_64_8]